MSTIDPNQGISGSNKTAGQVLGGSQDNPHYDDQILDFNQFLFFQNDKGLDGSEMEATSTPGEYLLTTQDGQQFKVINTDEMDVDPVIPMTEGDNPNLILGGDKDIDVMGDSEDNRIMGNLGDNEIAGGKGDDFLGGGAGDDALFGGSGDDELIGGEGNDQLEGGEGNDTFAYPSEVPPGEEYDESYNYGEDIIADFGQGEDTLILGDFNGDGVFDSNDYVIQNTENGALITFMGADGSRGSVLLQGINAEQLSVSAQNDVGQITLSGDSAQSTMEHDQGPLDDDNDDGAFFTII